MDKSFKSEALMLYCRTLHAARVNELLGYEGTSKALYDMAEQMLVPEVSGDFLPEETGAKTA